MTTTLTTNAESFAEKAESLSAFSGLKLLKIKQDLALLLELIGREQIFSEYTRHDISHIDRMLTMLDWLIPEETKQIMTPADWLMTVLSIYFHDLGMLVTKREYEARHSSGFTTYRDTVLFAGEQGADYRAKVNAMGAEVGERFLYQEFVRHTHAERIRSWIMGQSRERLGISNDVISVIDDMLSPLDEGFREDLAIVCESHHLDDLDNFKKYKVRRPYGNSDAEEANLQYAAILMRTTDLLHITKDRTPSTSFKLINPVDPISQEEWAKQMAVTTVRSQLGRDKDGNFDELAPRDTIEVHARFNKQEGFFALTNYIIYVSSQLLKSHDAARGANKTQGVRHKFPWRKIDDSHIETKGFLRDTFGFTIDQPRILKLLTGHTLYNDTNVVLRELVQNSLDAVRLQKLIHNQSQTPNYQGKIQIRWDSENRTLTVEDNGTGMSQEVIERNLLTVGASRYSDSEFKKRYPSFSAISRFGIGILSAFMIADVVEIVTSSPEDEQARQLSLRSVLGRYLIRLLDKEKDDVARSITPHGTIINLKVRHSAETPDILNIAKQWIVVPECDVTLKIDDTEPISIGASSPKEALERHLTGMGKHLVPVGSKARDKAICVKEQTSGGVTLAFALEWSEYFQEWTFFTDVYNRGPIHQSTGICIEGVRVEFSSPGFNGRSLLALANATGPNAPKTNVARSGLEATPDRDALLQTIYRIYCEHVESELQSLYLQRSTSLSWAIKESKYILASLIEGPAHSSVHEISPLNSKLLFDQIRDIQLLLIEEGGKRRAISPGSLAKERTFWTIDGPSITSAEHLIREVPGQGSLTILAELFQTGNLTVPDGVVLCGVNARDNYASLAFNGREVDQVLINRGQKRIDLRWTDKSEPARWRTFPQAHKIPESILQIVEPISHHYYSRRQNIQNLYVGHTDVAFSGGESLSALLTIGLVLIRYNSPIGKYLNTCLDRLERDWSRDLFLAMAGVFVITITLIYEQSRQPMDEETILNFLKRSESTQILEEFIDIDEFLSLVLNSRDVYDPTAWSR